MVLVGAPILVAGAADEERACYKLEVPARVVQPKLPRARYDSEKPSNTSVNGVSAGPASQR